MAKNPAPLRFSPEFLASLAWSRPHDPVSYICSRCGEAIDERAAPLRIMGPRYAVLCDDCVSIGLEGS